MVQRRIFQKDSYGSGTHKTEPAAAGRIQQGGIKGSLYTGRFRKGSSGCHHHCHCSEVELAVGAKAELAKEGVDVRVVSMPSMDVFEEQPEDYKEKVLPKAVRKRVAVEALGDFGWGRYVGLDGTTVTMKGFGASAPAGQLFKKFGFTVENVVAAVKSL